MTLTAFYTLLKSITGFESKVAYRQFRTGQAPALPFMVYYVEDSNNFLADNKVYLAKQNVVVELYSENKDVTSEGLVEKLFNDNDIPWRKSEDYIDSEHMYMITYEVTI